ncbi:hypothetical protein A2U01_0061002, partial [Trifolium medium]|nr:hypothetical protein [Trifolium medium]
IIDDLEELKYFLTLVNELHNYSAQLSLQGFNFLGSLQIMKRRLAVDLPLVHAMEEADRRNHNAASALAHEMSLVKED